MVQPLQPPLVDGELVPDPLLSHTVASAYNSDCSSDCRPSFQTFGDPRAPVAARHARSTVANRRVPRSRMVSALCASFLSSWPRKERKRKRKTQINPQPSTPGSARCTECIQVTKPLEVKHGTPKKPHKKTNNGNKRNRGRVSC